MQTDCQHVISRLVSKGGDAPEWVQESAWEDHGQFHWRCALCGEIRDTEWQRYCAD